MGGNQSHKRGLQDESAAEGQAASVSPNAVQTPLLPEWAWQLHREPGNAFGYSKLRTS